jgi:glycerate 2-kinase
VTPSTSSHRHQTNDTPPRLSPGRFVFLMSGPPPDTGRELAIAIYAAAVGGVDPRTATRNAMETRAQSATAPFWIIALGKASMAMARSAVDVLRLHNAEPEGGVIIAPEPGASPHPRITVAVGNHPLPSVESHAASELIASVADRIAGRGTVFVLLSGGATSLVAAPVEGVSDRDLTWMFNALLTSGADITVMNAVRKRFTRWGAGRLARALAPATVHCLIVSDVVGDDIPSIASGPCAPDPRSSAEVLALIEREGLEPFVPRPLRDFLRDPSPASEPPPVNDPVFERVECTVILGNRDALDAAAASARELGAGPIRVVGEPLMDDATFTAQRLIDELVRFREASLPDATRGATSTSRFACMLWGGETTVRLGAGEPVPGGRCQALALAAADAVHAEGDRGVGLTLLAAGTDGRDGNTDAAGAVVDAATWDAIVAAGRDPAEDLSEHRSHDALDSVGALVRTGLSGTNVGDVVVGIVERSTRQAALRR